MRVELPFHFVLAFILLLLTLDLEFDSKTLSLLYKNNAVSLYSSLSPLFHPPLKPVPLLALAHYMPCPSPFTVEFIGQKMN